MQDGRREAIHNPPQGKATQGGEQHGYQPSERRTNPTTRANGKKGGKRKERQETSGQDIKPLMLCFSTGTGLDESPFVEPFIQQCQTAYFCSSLALLYKQSAIKNPTNVGSLK